MKRTSSLLLVLAYCTCTNSEGAVFLERGGRGIVPCPPIASGRFTLEEIDAVYWYYNRKHRGSLLISYFRGNVAPQNGIPEGVYDINGEFSLVIEKVSHTDEGIYFCQVKPKMKMDETGHVGIYEKVSPGRPFPIVIGCNQRSSYPGQCEVEIDDYSVTDNLKCLVDSVKPAVELKWFRVFANGSKEQVDTSQTVRPVVLPPNKGTASRNNTFSTSTSLKLASVHDDVVYMCEAYGAAVGNGSHTIVSFVKAPSTTVTYSSARPPENTGTMPALTDATLLKTVIALAVVISILFVVIAVIMTRLYVVSRQKRRHQDKKYTLELATYKPIPTTNGTR